MESKVKITKEQIRAMHEHLSGLSVNNNRKKEDLKSYYKALHVFLKGILKKDEEFKKKEKEITHWH